MPEIRPVSPIADDFQQQTAERVWVLIHQRQFRTDRHLPSEAQ